jgi:hypothetical protein
MNLLQQLAAVGLPPPQTEARFHPVRKWRFDLLWPDRMIAVEIEGGAWVRGRHTRAQGYMADMVKYNEAVKMGYRLYRFTPDMVADGYALQLLTEVLSDDNHV